MGKGVKGRRKQLVGLMPLRSSSSFFLFSFAFLFRGYVCQAALASGNNVPVGGVHMLRGVCRLMVVVCRVLWELVEKLHCCSEGGMSGSYKRTPSW